MCGPCTCGALGQSIAGKTHNRGALAGTPRVLDAYGNNLNSVALGDHYRTRHDGVKRVIPQLCRWAGVECDTEVYNLFAGLLSHVAQEGLAGLGGKEKKQQG